MLKTRLSSLVTTTCFAFCSWSFVQPEVASAITLNYNGRTGNQYSYTLQLNSPDEYLAAGDTLDFTNLVGVTSANAVPVYFTTPYISATGDVVEFRATEDASNSNTFNFSIFSTAAPGTVNYLAEYQDSTFGGLSESATITGPAVAQAVPFEFSPSQGIALGLPLLIGLRMLKKRRTLKNSSCEVQEMIRSR